MVGAGAPVLREWWWPRAIGAGRRVEPGVADSNLVRSVAVHKGVVDEGVVHRVLLTTSASVV
jgi:hypothetical protein